MRYKERMHFIFIALNLYSSGGKALQDRISNQLRERHTKNLLRNTREGEKLAPKLVLKMPLKSLVVNLHIILQPESKTVRFYQITKRWQLEVFLREQCRNEQQSSNLHCSYKRLARTLSRQQMTKNSWDFRYRYMTKDIPYGLVVIRDIAETPTIHEVLVRRKWVKNIWWNQEERKKNLGKKFSHISSPTEIWIYQFTLKYLVDWTHFTCSFDKKNTS